MSTTRVGLGCVRLGGGDGRTVADDVRFVRAAVDLGVNVFDTADVYGGGASEQTLGRALKGHRDEVRIATKGGFVFRPRSSLEQWSRRRAKDVLRHLPDRPSRGSAPTVAAPTGYADQNFSPQFIRQAVHASLRRLGTDRIDVYQLHGPESFRPGLIEQLVDLVVAGDIVQLGVGADSIESADLWVGAAGVSVLQLPFGMLDPGAAMWTMPAAARHSQEVWVRGVLGGGLLGLMDRDPAALDEHPKGSRIRRLAELARRSGLDLHDLALRYALTQADGFSTVIVGSTSLDHLSHDIDVLSSSPIDPELRAAVELVADREVDQ